MCNMPILRCLRLYMLDEFPAQPCDVFKLRPYACALSDSVLIEESCRGEEMMAYGGVQARLGEREVKM